MKILFINPFSAYIRGGGEINDLNLAAALRRKGQDVVHIDARDADRLPFPYPDGAATVSVHLRYFYDHALKLPGLVGMAARASYNWYFLHCLKQQKKSLLQSADLILLTGKPMLSAVKKMTHGKVLLSVRGRNHSYMYPYYRKADGVIFWGGCDNDHPDAVKKGLSFLALNPAIERDIFKPDRRDEALRNGLTGQYRDAIVLIYVGRLDPVHQVDQIIRAVARMQNDCGHNVVLDIVGDGAQRSELESLAAHLLPDRVRFSGRLPRADVAHHLRAADVFIINPAHANHPIALKEALACGTYAMSPMLGRVEKILDGSPNGRAFRANDFDDMCAALDAVLRTKAYRGVDPSKSTLMLDSWDANATAILEWKKAHG